VIAPSQKESFGRAMMEIIAAGVPIIASRTGVVPDVMGAGSPWTFSPGNPDDLACTWINLPSLWSKRLDFVCQWQKKLLDGFLLEGATRKLIKVYMQILSKKSL
jgi:glycosyltransferase involved in cell wall biosynthesis